MREQNVIELRPARPADERQIREVTRSAKGHWGYDEQRVRTWAAGMSLKGEIEVAEVDGAVVAWSALLPVVDGVCVLDDLWVAPPWMGRGLGAELFQRAAARARELGATALELEAEPNAVGFYEKVGARMVGDRMSEWDRLLPVMRVDL